MHIDPLYTAHIDRQNAASIIRHCKFERQCDQEYGGHAYLHENPGLERAAKMLERRGYGVTYRATTDGRGALCFRIN